ncbi:conserved hypothetical protein [Burkholderia sp. 8Y]|uniref:STY1053 family phage-associated protein n=1 Tax=Burkholderia sp. 8Y TaxID=2653133 RepID=UPI0012EFFE05|nr:hypothetical protein [Burkholderia sp. 8Y]VXB24788.1 conserved hypothetical protein [Burkholderia sp. 8Y]
MAKLIVEKPFVLTDAAGLKREFPAGEHEVDDATANHWYVQAHAQVVKPEMKTAKTKG